MEKHSNEDFGLVWRPSVEPLEIVYGENNPDLPYLSYSFDRSVDVQQPTRRHKEAASQICQWVGYNREEDEYAHMQKSNLKLLRRITEKNSGSQALLAPKYDGFTPIGHTTWWSDDYFEALKFIESQGGKYYHLCHLGVAHKSEHAQKTVLELAHLRKQKKGIWLWERQRADEIAETILILQALNAADKFSHETNKTILHILFDERRLNLWRENENNAEEIAMIQNRLQNW